MAAMEAWAALAGGRAMANPPSERNLQFSTTGSDQAICYEVQPQRTSVWCVAASMKMLLDFYRYEYTQQRLAKELGLGTLANPKGLPISKVDKVGKVIGAKTSKALVVTKLESPTWEDFRDEIAANRPAILFLPGHARTIAGYKGPGPVPSPLSTPRRLLVYDPAMGGGNFWEDPDSQVYMLAFMARLNLA